MRSGWWCRHSPPRQGKRSSQSCWALCLRAAKASAPLLSLTSPSGPSPAGAGAKTRLTTASLAASLACSKLPGQTLGLTSSSLAQHNSAEASVRSQREPLKDTKKSPPPVPQLLDFPCKKKSLSCLSQSPPPYQNDYVPAPSVHKSRADHD